MKPLRTLRLRNYALPLALAGLISWALEPSDFMTLAQDHAAAGASVQSPLCSRNLDRRSSIELPGEGHARTCDHCLSPMGLAPIAFMLAPATMASSPLLAARQVDPVVYALPLRARVGRAPPRA